MNATSLVVSFRQSDLLLVNHEGQPFVPMRPVVQGMGLDWKSQHVKLTTGRFAPVMVEITTTGSDGKQYQMTCLPLRKLPGWMMSIHPNKVKPELRENIVAYQNECDDALWSYWNEGQATNPRSKPKKPKTLPNGLTIDQQEAIQGLVKARLEGLPQDKRAGAAIKCWSALKNKFGCTYKKIEPQQFTEAVSLVARLELEGEFLGKEATPDTTLDELDLAMLYVFCIDTLELVYVGEKLKPVFETLRAPLTMNVRKCLSECREAVAHLHERFGPQMEQAARLRGAFDGRRNLAAAGDPSQPIWVQHRA